MERYTRTAMVMHWLIALLIVAAFTLGLVMVDIPGFTPTKLKYFSWHKWLGVTVLALAALRLLWRHRNRPPQHAPGMAAWQTRAADVTHVLLYILMFAVPLSGYLYTTAAGVPVVYLGLWQIPAAFGPDTALKAALKPVHYWLNMTLAALVVMHVAAALKHHFVDRDDVLKRMLP